MDNRSMWGSARNGSCGKLKFWLSAFFSLCGLTAAGAPAVMPFPEGTLVKASFLTEADGNPENLIDGDAGTTMRGRAGTCSDPKAPVWVDFVFPEPVRDLAGVETGKSDPFHNYYPKKAQFWIDADGDGKFEYKGCEAELGPADSAAGRHMFPGRFPEVKALRFLVTEQNKTGLGRSFIMDEVRLVCDSGAKDMRGSSAGNFDDVLAGAERERKAAEEAARAERLRNAPKPDQSIVPGADKLPGRVIALPEGTQLSATRGVDGKNGPANLFDGNPDTWLAHAGNTCRESTDTASVILKFPEPMRDIGGVETGESDAFHNYYPIELEFWGDSDGDGRCDTLLGRTRNVGPASKCVGRHSFDGKLSLLYALEVRAVEQHAAGAKRAFTMNEMRLVSNPDLPVLEATPRRWMATYHTRPVPRGTTARVTVPTEDGLGAEALLDNDPTTFMNPKQGTARKGIPVSVFLTFPEPVKEMCGIVLGRSDPYNNYVWEEMEIRADTDGDGKCETLAATVTGGGAGRKRFNEIPEAYGLELRVTRQKLGGAMRAFMLSGVDGLVFSDMPPDCGMRVVLEDFEDLSSWRTWADNTAQPEGERYYGGYTYICGVLDEKAPYGKAAGRIRYCFKEPRDKNAVNWLRAKRGRVSEIESFMDSIEFAADPQGYPCSINFEIFDSKGRKVHTPAVTLEGSGWRKCVIDLSADAWPEASKLSPPYRIEHLWLRSKKGGTGDVLIDNITATGVTARGNRISIKPVWEGMAYDPGKPVAVKYTVRNGLGMEACSELKAELFAASDPKKKNPLRSISIPLKLKAFEERVVTVDFGRLQNGSYEAEISFRTADAETVCSDFVAVTKLNGGRVNKVPGFVGSQHPADWISDAENEFVFREVVGPIGLDCYRTGAPDKRILDLGMLCAAGFGGLPKELWKPGVKRPEINEPSDYEAYTDWVKKQAEEKYAPYAGSILAVEYYNEPDLPDFCYIPEIDVFLKMWRAWAEGMRAGAPGVRLGTGGNTVQHGKEKKDFNRRMYTELAKEADVAVWHAHGPLNNYTSRHRMVEGWMEEGGRPVSRQLLGNTEAGAISRNSPVERLQQAETLVKKIGWSKSQPDTLYYVWFTTTDTYDPQGGYLGGDNWGLISANQRLKPSGVAMNELIRQLANTKGLGEVELDPGLLTCAYENVEDGSKVWLSWPNESGASMLLTLDADGPVTVTDMFGASRTAVPENGVISIECSGLPFYMRAAKGVSVSKAKAPDWISVRNMCGVRAGGTASFGATLRAGEENVRFDISVETLDGKRVVSESVSVPRGEEKIVDLSFVIPEDLNAGSRGYVLRAVRNGKERAVLPLTVAVGELVPAVGESIVSGDKPKVPGNCAVIKVDGIEGVHDLVDDPSTPRWAGADDLSANVSLAHDGEYLLFSASVRDQKHIPGPPGEKLWISDSVQIAFYADGKQTEIGLTSSGGGSGYCWMSPSAAVSGRELNWPLDVSVENGKVTYTVAVPFKDLGVEYRPGMSVRMTFLVNEDDGRGRVRLLKWFDGIHPGKDVVKFGHLVLE